MGENNIPLDLITLLYVIIFSCLQPEYVGTRVMQSTSGANGCHDLNYTSSMSVDLLHPPWQYSCQTCRGRHGQGGGNTYHWATHTLTPHTRDHTQTLQESVCFLPCSFGGANWSELDGDRNQPEGFLTTLLSGREWSSTLTKVSVSLQELSIDFCNLKACLFVGRCNLSSPTCGHFHV